MSAHSPVSLLWASRAEGTHASVSITKMTVLSDCGGQTWSDMSLDDRGGWVSPSPKVASKDTCKFHPVIPLPFLDTCWSSSLPFWLVTSLFCLEEWSLRIWFYLVHLGSFGLTSNLFIYDLCLHSSFDTFPQVFPELKPLPKPESSLCWQYSEIPLSAPLGVCACMCKM